MKDRKPYALPKTKLRDEAEGQQKRAHSLKHERGAHDKVRHADYAAHLGRGNGFLHNKALAQADALAGKDGHGDGHCYDAHAAHLYEHKYHALAKTGPEGIGIMHHKAGHAGGGGGGKKRIHKRGGVAASGRYGKAEQPCAHHYHRKKSDNDYICRS